MTTRLENYIAAANANPKHASMKGAIVGRDYMLMLDHVLDACRSMEPPRLFDVDKLDGYLQEIISGGISEGLLADIKAAMAMHGE